MRRPWTQVSLLAAPPIKGWGGDGDWGLPSIERQKKPTKNRIQTLTTVVFLCILKQPRVVSPLGSTVSENGNPPPSVMSRWTWISGSCPVLPAFVLPLISEPDLKSVALTTFTWTRRNTVSWDSWLGLHKFLWASTRTAPESCLSQNDNSQMFSLPSQSFHKYKLRSEFFQSFYTKIQTSFTSVTLYPL